MEDGLTEGISAVRRILSFILILFLTLPVYAATGINSFPAITFPIPDPGNPSTSTENLWITHGNGAGTDFRVTPTQLGYIFQGASAPTTPFRYQLWWNTTTNPAVLSVYSGTAWISIGSFDYSSGSWVPVVPPVGYGTLAAAPTVELGSLSDTAINITGADSITSFGNTAPVGTIKVLIFSGASTIVANALTMILPGNANITTASGDVVSMLSTGIGVWKLVDSVPVTTAMIGGLGTGVAAALAVDVGTPGAFVVNGGVLGTPSSGTLTNATGLPISTGVSGLGTGIATALGVNVGTAGSVVVNGGALGTPSSGTLTNATGLPVATGISGLGASVATALGVDVGTAGSFVVNGGALGTPSSANLANATGLPISTGVSGLGTGIATALGINVGTAGSVVVNGGVLGTPSSGTLTNATGLPITSGLTSIPQGGVSGHRLTLTSGTPVLTATVSGATTIYSTPYNGSLIAFYDGTNWHWRVCAEMSNITTNSSTGNAGPAAVGANSVYDLYAWENSGVCTLTRSPAWSSSTTRGTGAGTAEQERVNGVWMNKQAITNGPAADRGTYLGTVSSNGSSQIDFILGGSASGGTACFLNVWNNYNRIGTRCRVIDSGTGYTYSSATIREARGSTTNAGNILIGQQEDQITAFYTQRGATAATATANAAWGIGFDSTTTFYCTQGLTYAPTANVNTVGGPNSCVISPTIGAHVISANEVGDGTTTTTFDGFSLATLQFEVRN